jgi:tetrahydromethanopterin S-methyltransferase subunit B
VLVWHVKSSSGTTPFVIRKYSMVTTRKIVNLMSNGSSICYSLLTRTSSQDSFERRQNVQKCVALFEKTNFELIRTMSIKGLLWILLSIKESASRTLLLLFSFLAQQY